MSARNDARRRSAMSLSTPELVLSWALRLSAAAILLQTLFFKFTGSAESVYIFTQVGAEPWGRIGSGIAELLAAALLLIPVTAPVGAAISVGLMTGAVGSHLTVLGIEVMGDGGLLFGLAGYVLIASLVVLVLHRADLPLLGRHFQRGEASMSPGGAR